MRTGMTGEAGPPTHCTSNMAHTHETAKRTLSAFFPANDRDQHAQGVHLGERAKRLTVHNVSDDDGIVRLHAS